MIKNNCIFIILVLLISCAKNEEDVIIKQENFALPLIEDKNIYMQSDNPKLSLLNINDLLIENTNIVYKIINGKGYRIIDDEYFFIENNNINTLETNGILSYYWIFHQGNLVSEELEILGAYIFDNGGNFITIIPIPFIEKELTNWITITPNENYIGFDNGTWLVRIMEFYTFPEYEYIITITYTGNVFWDNNILYYTTKAGQGIPYANFDNDEYNVIKSINFENMQIDTVFEYTELENPELINLQGNELTIRIYYVDHIEDWGGNNSIKEKEIKISKNGI